MRIAVPLFALALIVSLIVSEVATLGSARAQGTPPFPTSVIWQLQRLPEMDEFGLADAHTFSKPSNRYAIEFLSDGTASIVADCNRLIGRWSRTGATGIDIVISLSALSGCPYGSYEEHFLIALDEATEFELADSKLTLKLPDDREVTFVEAALSAS
jgi:heat shock protein HslJ